MLQDPNLLTVSEVSRLLRCSRRAVYDLVKRGRVRAITIGIQRAMRIPASEIECLLGENLSSTPDSENGK